MHSIQIMDRTWRTQTTIRRAAMVFGGVLLAFPAFVAAGSPGPEPEIDGLILREKGQVIVTVWQGQVTGEIAVGHLETTGDIAVTWLDPDSTEFQLGMEHELRWEIGDPAIASYSPTGPWSFTITGEADGMTDLVLSVFHIDHIDFTSPPIEIHVEDHLEPAGLRLYKGGEVITTVWQGQVSGGVVAGVGRSTGTIQVVFLLEDGDEIIPDDPDFEMQLVVANGAIATLTANGPWSFVGHGLVAGGTTFEVKIFHIDHVDWSSPPIPITIVPLAVAVDAPPAAAGIPPATLLPAKPNPCNPATIVSYRLSDETEVELGIYDMAGRLVAELVQGRQPAGLHGVRWEPQGLASGVYFLRLQTPAGIQVEKVLLAK